MKILVANIGSSSFKFRLFDFDGAGQRELAAGGVDRIGGRGGKLTCRLALGEPASRPCPCGDHAQAIKACLKALAAAEVLENAQALDAVAFKAVMGGDIEPVVFVDEKVLAAMEYFVPVAPAHNPAYVAAMRSFRDTLPDTPLVAAFEPGFHRTIPLRRRLYAAPPQWAEKFGIRRYGFHGASLRYVAERTAELMAGRARRIIICHLGGSSSVCAVRDGQSVATSMGFSAQSGLPQGTRVGDFDCFALAVVARETGKGVEQMLTELGDEAGLAAMSGTGGDMRDIEAAAETGDERACLTIDVFTTAARDYVGAYLVELGGADALVFTGGIGQNSPLVRSKVCEGLDFAGIMLDAGKNAAAEGECRIDAAPSPTAIWVMPTNEELIVARQAAELLAKASQREEDSSG
jgi:acetate kinase